MVVCIPYRVMVFDVSFDGRLLSWSLSVADNHGSPGAEKYETVIG